MSFIPLEPSLLKAKSLLELCFCSLASLEGGLASGLCMPGCEWVSGSFAALKLSQAAW